MIQDFKDMYKGETALIIGNGPSLDKTPLHRLMKQYTSFGSNKIYNFPFPTSAGKCVPQFWSCADGNMLHDCIPWVMDPDHAYFNAEKFVPRTVPLPGGHGMNLEVKIGFSEDAAQVIYMGGTITYINMQLAKHMGFKRLLLVGMDHKYANTVKGGRPGTAFIANGYDPDHFQGKAGPYFTPGRIYNRPELEATVKYFYPLANRMFDIINLSAETTLTCFKRDKAENWIK